MIGVMAIIDKKVPLAKQIVILSDQYKARTGRAATTVCIHPDTLSKTDLSASAMSIKSARYVQPQNLWVGECR